MKTNKRVWDKWISQCEAVPLEDIYNEKYLFADGIFRAVRTIPNLDMT